MALSGKSDAMALFSTVCYSLCDTSIDFRSLSILESQFSKTWRHKAILWGKGDSGLSYSRIDEIPESHLTETEKRRKVNLFRQSHLTNL
jgi:hypothetical protein